MAKGSRVKISVGFDVVRNGVILVNDIGIFHAIFSPRGLVRDEF